MMIRTFSLLQAYVPRRRRFNARRVFLVSAWLGAACNAGFALLSDGLTLALAFRFLTGVTLAGNLAGPASAAAARVFDTASAVLTGQVEKTCETQTPLRLEGLCRRRKDPVYLSLSRDAAGLLRSDWRPLLDMLVDERLSPAGRSERFHASLALSMLQQARRIADEMPIDNVGLCGSILQDRMLTEQACDLLTRNDFHVHLPLRLPFDDAALGFGQAAELAAREAR